MVLDKKIWVPTYDYITGTTEFYQDSKMDQYVTVFFTSVLMVLGNEVGPWDSFQLMFLSSFLVGSAIINAHIFGSLAVIVQELNRKSTIFFGKLDAANNTMENLRLPKELKSKVINYIIYTHSGQEQQDEIK